MMVNHGGSFAFFALAVLPNLSVSYLLPVSCYAVLQP